MREAKRSLARTKREMARFRKAIETANSCKFRADCPVIFNRLHEHPRGNAGEDPDGGDGADRDSLDAEKFAGYGRKRYRGRR